MEAKSEEHIDVEAPKENSGIQLQASSGISHVLLASPSSSTATESSDDNKETYKKDVNEEDIMEEDAPPAASTVSRELPVRDIFRPGDIHHKEATKEATTEETTKPSMSNNHGYSSDDDYRYDSPGHPHDNDDEPHDEQSRRKREKRLAMNRASARERRRRKRLHTEELEKRVLQLSRQCAALQKSNEGFQLYVAKLESDLSHANAAIAVLGSSKPPKVAAALKPRAVLPPSVEQGLLGGGARPNLAAAAAAMQEQERVRALLGMLQQQQQQQQDTAAAALARFPPSSRFPQHNKDDMQQQVLLQLLAARQQQQQQQPTGLEAIAASLAGLGGPPSAASAMDTSVTSLLAAQSMAAPSAARGSDPLASYLNTLSRGNPLRMVSAKLSYCRM